MCTSTLPLKEPILKDSSTRGTAVSYDGQAKEEVRHHFTWILEPEKEEGGVGNRSTSSRPLLQGRVCKAPVLRDYE